MIRVTLRTRPARAVCFDLENRPLAYWYDGQTTSEITAFGWKWSDEKRVRTMLLAPDGTYVVDDGEVLSARDALSSFARILESADLTYGHNIRRHDLPMLNAHLFRHQLTPLTELRTTDTCRDLPKVAGVSKSLENMAAMYGLRVKKYTMSQPMWEDANRLTDAGRALATKRVASDVVLQVKLRQRLLELGILKEPRMWRP